jgi:protocatechuate 3,4-dioxygenase beta subunit
MKHFVTMCVIAAIAAACGSGEAEVSRDPLLGGPCEACDAIYVGMPDSISWHERIAPRGEPGEPLRIDGVVRKASGAPVAGIIVYAYHTNAKGIYPRDERYASQGVRHGKLRGWARTNAQGAYRFDTIRPAGYPNSDLPQHIHMHVIEPGRGHYWIDDIEFDDDPRLTGVARNRQNDRGGNGLAKPTRVDGTWHVTRDIILGMNIPDYPTPNSR